MQIHRRAALTIEQRQEVRRLHVENGASIRGLAERFHVNPSTVQRWVAREVPLDLSSAPLRKRTTITPEYRQSVIECRRLHPRHGPLRIAAALKERYSQAHRGTVLKILQEEGLTKPPRKEKKPRKAIPVGRHRIQVDVQQLPAVKGGKGFEYKITAIHLRTRVKYSEIHPDRRSTTVAGVLKRALDMLPPFSSSGQITPSSLP